MPTLVLKLAVEYADFFGDGVIESLFEACLMPWQIFVAYRLQFRQIARQGFDGAIEVVFFLGAFFEERSHRRR